MKWIIGSAVVLATAGFAMAGSVPWATAGHGGDAGSALARDQAVQSAREGIAVFNTLDYHAVDDGLRRWQSVSTGALHDQLDAISAQSRQQIADAKTVTTARVLDVAATELDASRGTAEVIAAVEITVTPDGGQPQTKRGRFQAELTRTDAGWKLSGLDQVPMGASS